MTDLIAAVADLAAPVDTSPDAPDVHVTVNISQEQSTDQASVQLAEQSNDQKVGGDAQPVFTTMPREPPCVHESVDLAGDYGVGVDGECRDELVEFIRRQLQNKPVRMLCLSQLQLLTMNWLGTHTKFSGPMKKRMLLAAVGEYMAQKKQTEAEIREVLSFMGSSTDVFVDVAKGRNVHFTPPAVHVVRSILNCIWPVHVPDHRVYC